MHLPRHRSQSRRTRTDSPAVRQGHGQRSRILGRSSRPARSHYWSTGEGWYFSGTQPTTLYTLVIGDSKLRRYDVLTRQFEAVPAMDLARCPRPRVCPGVIGISDSGAFERQRSRAFRNGAGPRVAQTRLRGVARRQISPTTRRQPDRCSMNATSTSPDGG